MMLDMDSEAQRLLETYDVPAKVLGVKKTPRPVRRRGRGVTVRDLDDILAFTKMLKAKPPR